MGSGNVILSLSSLSYIPAATSRFRSIGLADTYDCCLSSCICLSHMFIFGKRVGTYFHVNSFSFTFNTAANSFFFFFFKGIMVIVVDYYNK